MKQGERILPPSSFRFAAQSSPPTSRTVGCIALGVPRDSQHQTVRPKAVRDLFVAAAPPTGCDCTQDSATPPAAPSFASIPKVAPTLACCLESPRGNSTFLRGQILAAEGDGGHPHPPSPGAIAQVRRAPSIRSVFGLRLSTARVRILVRLLPNGGFDNDFFPVRLPLDPPLEVIT